MLIGHDEKRARTAGRVEHPQGCRLLQSLSFQKRPNGILHNVLDDVGRRVLDPARLLHLRLVLDHGIVAFIQPDDLAQKLLVNLA